MTLIDKILRERELQSERIVAIVRFGFISFISGMDVLSFFGFIAFTEIKPTLRTVILDGVFLFLSALLLAVGVRKIYHGVIKYLSVAMDFLLIAMMLVYDPTVSGNPQDIPLFAFLASIYLFFLNLLRFSKNLTVFTGALSLAFYNAICIYHGVLFYTNYQAYLVSIAITLIIGYFLTSSNRKMMTEANAKLLMERYLPPQLVGELYKGDANIEPGGIKQQVTVLFSDIRSFTTLSERLSPDDVVRLLNDYLSTMTDVIYANNGTIDKFIGDAVMTLFGAPIRKEDDAERAVRTAVAMMSALKLVNERHSETEFPIEIGVGIHTGVVIAGNIGSDKRLDYTVIGDDVNVASRIEGLTKHYRCPILISGATYDELGRLDAIDKYVIREVDTIIVKGKSKSIKIYEILSGDENKIALINLKETFEAGLALYKRGRFNEALRTFSACGDDPLARIYIKRCRYFMQNPPAIDKNWTVVTVMDKK